VLAGNDSEKVRSFGHHRLSVFGIADEEELALMKPVARALLARDALRADEYGGLSFGPGQVIYGLPSTVPVTLEMMCAHGAAVVRGSWHAVVASTCRSAPTRRARSRPSRSAARILKETGAAAVKLEGGEAMAETVAFLTRAAFR
jgi:hypothetical protein